MARTGIALASEVEALEASVATKAEAAALTAHTASTSNPHGVTAAQAGAYTTVQVDSAIENRTPKIRRAGRLRPPSLKRIWRAQTDTTTGWSVSGAPARAILSQDTTNYRSSLSTPQGSLKITNNSYLGTANCDYTLGSTANGANALLYSRLRVNNATGLDGISVFLRTGVAWTDYGSRRIFDAAYFTLDGEWYEMWCPVGDLTATGTPNYAAIDLIRIAAVWSAANTTASVTVDEIALYTPSSRTPRHCITLDDGNAADYAYAVALAARGLVGTFYVVPSLIGTTNYLTLAQLHAIRDMGHLVANHSYNHRAWRTEGLSLTQRRDEVESAAEWLEANGFADGARHFAQPGGSSEIDTTSYSLLRQYCDTWRMTPHQSLVQPPDSREVLWTQAFDSASNATTALNRSIGGQGDTITGWHPGSVTLSTFTAYADSVAAARDAGSVDVVTVADL